MPYLRTNASLREIANNPACGTGHTISRFDVSDLLKRHGASSEDISRLDLPDVIDADRLAALAKGNLIRANQLITALQNIGPQEVFAKLGSATFFWAILPSPQSSQDNSFQEHAISMGMEKDHLTKASQDSSTYPDKRRYNPDIFLRAYQFRSITPDQKLLTESRLTSSPNESKYALGKDFAYPSFTGYSGAIETTDRNGFKLEFDVYHDARHAMIIYREQLPVFRITFEVESSGVLAVRQLQGISPIKVTKDGAEASFPYPRMTDNEPHAKALELASRFASHLGYHTIKLITPNPNQLGKLFYPSRCSY